MPDTLGFSVYLSTYAGQRTALTPWKGSGAPVFLSLHISEEFDDSYCSRAQQICDELAAGGFRIIADVSVKTVSQFGEPDLTRLANRLHLWALRIDYGFSEEEIGALAQKMPIVLNASTTDPAAARRICAQGSQVWAMHNFYPRPETGLDRQYLLQTTRALQDAGLKVMAFIPGDLQKRGPIFEGLPTLEEHRHCLPSAAYVDLKQNFGMDEIFVSDPGLSEAESLRIRRYCEEGVISLPATLLPEYESLYAPVFTNRIDSPAWMIRFQESRTYSCFGRVVEPAGCTPRYRGSITIDNIGYGRYSGEVQLIRSDLPADDRVNVIGQINKKAQLLMDCVRRGCKFTLVPEK